MEKMLWGFFPSKHFFFLFFFSQHIPFTVSLCQCNEDMMHCEKELA